MLKPKHQPKPSSEVERITDAEALELIAAVLHHLPNAQLEELTSDQILSSHEAIDGLGSALSELLKGRSLAARSAHWAGQSWIGPNCLIGPDCIVGPNSYLCQSALLTRGVRVGFSVEIDH